MPAAKTTQTAKAGQPRKTVEKIETRNDRRAQSATKPQLKVAPKKPLSFNRNDTQPPIALHGYNVTTMDEMDKWFRTTDKKMPLRPQVVTDKWTAADVARAIVLTICVFLAGAGFGLMLSFVYGV